MNDMAHLQAALVAIRSKDFDRANELLKGVLVRLPNNSDALQLLGMVRKAQGLAEEAIQLLRASLKAQPDQPHVLNNLANLLGQDEQIEAVSLYRKAIAFNPQYTDAIANLAGVLLLQQKSEEARAQFQAALEINPNHLQSLLGLAALQIQAAALPDAKVTVLKAIEQSSHNQRAFSLLGDILAAQEAWDQAVDAYGQALKLGKPTDGLWTAYGAALRYALRDQEAFEAFSSALALNPANVLAHRNLNALLWNYGHTDRYLDSYRTMLPLVPDSSDVRIAFIEDLLRHGEVAEAKALVTQLDEVAPFHRQLSFVRGRIASASGDLTEAGALFRRAIQDDPDNSEPRIWCIDNQLRVSNFLAAAELAEESLALFPDNQEILARLVTANRLGNLGDTQGLWNLDQFVQTIDLVPPNGRSVANFNGELAEYLRTLHVTTTSPVDQTLRGGTQTFGNLLGVDKSDIIQMLATMFRSTIECYIEQLPFDSNHPVSRRKQSDFEFAGSWSARLGANGFHTNHIHPKGWISSAYYVALPPETQDQQKKAGWFRLGQTNMHLGEDDIALKLIEPRVGRLILFPSYYWHGTTPFHDEAERLTVAFDVVPK